MPQVSVSAPDAFVVGKEFTVHGTKTYVKASEITRKYGQLLLTRIKAKAAGRPGPRIITGDYNRSWNMRTTSNALQGISAEVGTNAPQGRRLEFGFHGTDSLGRNYDQPPFPHVRPAIDMIAPQYEKALESIVDLDRRK